MRFIEIQYTPLVSFGPNPRTAALALTTCFIYNWFIFFSNNTGQGILLLHAYITHHIHNRTAACLRAHICLTNLPSFIYICLSACLVPWLPPSMQPTIHISHAGTK